MRPKVLFVRSGNKGSHPITQNQGDSLQMVGCDVHYFEVVGKGWRGYLGNVFRLRSYVRQHKPQVIHAHYSFCGFLSSVSFTGLPVVVSLMGSDVLTSRSSYLRLLRFFSRVFWKSVIVKSEEMHKRLGWDKALVIPNGVNASDFFYIEKNSAREKLGWSKVQPVVLFAANPDRSEKNYPLFRLALDAIKVDGEIVNEQHLFNLNKEEMNLYYNASDVLVLTSDHEGSPNVIKEAMFCNCPCISVDVGDVKQWVDCTKGNYIVERDALAIARMIEQVIKTKIPPSNQSAKEALDARLIAEKLKQLYISLIK